jgi:hypothetical protein
MKAFFIKVKNLAVAGFFFLLPAFVFFIVVTKAWTYLSTLGIRIAALFGMKTIMGLGSDTVFSGLLLERPLQLLPVALLLTKVLKSYINKGYYIMKRL